MVEGHEILALVLGVVTLVMGLYKRHALASVPHYRLLAVSYVLYLCSWALALVIYSIPDYPLHLSQHLCDATGSLFLLLWSWFSLARPGVAG